MASTTCPYTGHSEEGNPGGDHHEHPTWFQIESFTTVEMQTRLRAAMGMGAAHVYRLIEGTGEGHLMTTVMRHTVSGARERLGGETPHGECPACEAVRFATERAIHLVVGGLLDPAHARLYAQHTGMCVPHVVQASRMAEPSILKLLADRLRESLGEADDGALVELLAGVDRDPERRRRWRGELPEHPGAGSTVGRLCDRLAIEACPVCLSVGWSERRYVEWFVARNRERDPSIRSDPGELCSAHLNDVALADPAVAAGAAQDKRAARLGELHRLLDNLSELTPIGRRGRRARQVDDLDRMLVQFVAAHRCPACHARSEIYRSQLALLIASTALPAVRERYVHSHGLCVRHAMNAGDGQVARLVRHHADARLGVLGWELEETARKYARACRHEPIGPEHTASLRAVAQVDGRVFEGSSPHAEPG